MKSQKNYLNFEDKFYVLFEFIEGEIFHLSPENKPSVEVAIQAGETLAALHNVLTKYQTTNKKTEICILN